MGRKRQSSFLDDVFEMLMTTPFWVGPLLALAAFALFRFVIPYFLQPKPGTADVGVLVRGLMPMLSWAFGGAILLAWGMAEIHKLAHRSPKPHDSPTAPSSNKSHADTAPTCPSCGAAMVRRTARKGQNAGSQFWGCSTYPGCKGTRQAS